jgi:hypothetical protein
MNQHWIEHYSPRNSVQKKVLYYKREYCNKYKLQVLNKKVLLSEKAIGIICVLTLSLMTKVILKQNLFPNEC